MLQSLLPLVSAPFRLPSTSIQGFRSLSHSTNKYLQATSCLSQSRGTSSGHQAIRSLWEPYYRFTHSLSQQTMRSYYAPVVFLSLLSLLRLLNPPFQPSAPPSAPSIPCDPPALGKRANHGGAGESHNPEARGRAGLTDRHTHTLWLPGAGQGSTGSSSPVEA